jgi:hypothetical protein
MSALLGNDVSHPPRSLLKQVLSKVQKKKEKRKKKKKEKKTRFLRFEFFFSLTMASTAAYDWKFGQVFGEKAPIEEVGDGMFFFFAVALLSAVLCFFFFFLCRKSVFFFLFSFVRAY